MSRGDFGGGESGYGLASNVGRIMHGVSDFRLEMGVTDETNHRAGGGAGGGDMAGRGDGLGADAAAQLRSICAAEHGILSMYGAGRG